MQKDDNGKLNIGIIGLGSIGSFLIDGLHEERYLDVIAAADISAERREAIAAKYPDITLTDDFSKFSDDVDVYVECATASIADAVAKYAIERGKIAIIASVGGLSDIRLLRRLARDTGGHIYIPSGAIGGLDALKSIPTESIREVKITTTKNPANFKGAAYLMEKDIDLDNLTGPTVVFEGNAGDAVQAFPRNVNVSAILSYAGIGRENTKVVVMADPAITVNRHEIYINSDHGEIRVQVNNVPFELNPRTSKLAAFSILAAVKSLVYTITIG